MCAHKRKIVVILGAGRSGTSLAANVIHQLGVRMSDQLTAASEHNQKGAWEDKEILRISRDVLRHLHRNSYKLSYLPMQDGWLNDEYVFKKRTEFIQVVRSSLEIKEGLWGFKEPVTAKLLPMWKLIFDELDLDPIYILCLRRPEQVIQSYAIAYDAPNVISENVWLSRYADAVLHTGGDFLVIDYSIWFSDGETLLKKVTDKLDLPLSNRVLAGEILGKTFDASLSKATEGIADLISPLSGEFYNALLEYVPEEGNENIMRMAKEVSDFLTAKQEVISAVDFVGKSLAMTENKLEIQTEFLKKSEASLLRFTNPTEYIMEKRKCFPRYVGKKIGGVASFNKREAVFKESIESVVDQLDHIFVFLNDYRATPEYLLRENITVFHGRDYIDLSANGKVFYLDKLEDCYFFSLDDDIKYPSNYVSEMLSAMKKYNDKVAVSVHGSIFPEIVEWYYERLSLYAFQSELTEDKFVTLIGSGTFAFHTNTLRAEFKDFMPDVMVDLKFSLLAREQGVPLVCIARPKLWLKALVKGTGLFQDFVGRKTVHTDVSVANNPWGFERYSKFIGPLITKQFPELSDKIAADLKLDLAFLSGCENNTPPENWMETGLYKKKIREREIYKNPIEACNKLMFKNKKLKSGNMALKSGNMALKSENMALKSKNMVLRSKLSLFRDKNSKLKKKISSSISGRISRAFNWFKNQLP